MIERYRDKEAFNAHSSTPHFKDFMGKAPGFLAGKPDIKIYEEMASI